MSHVVRTRFAPSPTGRLHVGNVRTAYYSWLLARSLGGRFLLRIEDTDAARGDEGYVAAIEADLRWLGLDWDEGPGTDGGPWRQSERGELYARRLAELEVAGHVYACYRTDDELAAFRRRCADEGRPPIFDRAWGLLPDDEVRRRREAGHQPHFRFRMPDVGEAGFDDLLKGPQRFPVESLGDFVVRRSDGTHAFLFANAVDDAAMGVTHVLRGEDHVSNTVRQCLLLEALGEAPPTYGHLPLIVDDHGRPLSKRGDDTAVATLREAGVLPVALRNYLLRLGHAVASEALLDAAGQVATFSPGGIAKGHARYDAAQLRHWQRAAVLDLDNEALRDWVGSEPLAGVPEDERDRFLSVVRPNLEVPGDAALWARIVYDAPLDPAASAWLDSAGPAFFEAAAAAVDQHGPDLAAVKRAVGEATGAKGKALFMPLRLALTGLEHGPELGPLMAIIPAARLHERLARRAR